MASWSCRNMYAFKKYIVHFKCVLTLLLLRNYETFLQGTFLSVRSRCVHNVMASISDGHKKLPTPLISNKAHQPRSFKFPKSDFGKTSVVKSSFQPQWFDKWQWLHYSEEKDLAFGLTCIVAYENNHLVPDWCLEPTFISTGFCNCKDAALKFNKHEGRRCHKDVLLKTNTIPTTSKDVSEMFSSELAKEREERRKAFLNPISHGEGGELFCPPPHLHFVS